MWIVCQECRKERLTLEAAEAAELALAEAEAADLLTEWLATEAADVADLLATLASEEIEAGSVTPAANPPTTLPANEPADWLATEANELTEALAKEA